MEFADIHIHGLYASDDGAKTKEQMCAMVDAAYADGSRLLCLTPHFHPGYFGDNRQKSESAFRELAAYAAEKYPSLKLILANELRYSRGCLSWLEEGACRTLGRTRYVLVDFAENETQQNITDGLQRLLNAGYSPILAHAERYRNLWGKREILGQLRRNGVLLQLDARSVLGDFGLRTKWAAKGILSERLADLVGSDAHDLRRRPPGIREAYDFIEKKYSKMYADAVCGGNALNLLRNAERM